MLNRSSIHTNLVLALLVTTSGCWSSQPPDESKVVGSAPAELRYSKMSLARRVSTFA